MSSAIKKIAQYEKRFAKRNYNGGRGRKFIIKDGKIPIMISAPHAVNHYREKEKKAEKYTGGIAKYLQKITQCHIIYSTQCLKNDPNYEEEGEYKRVLKEYVEDHGIKVLIDLHGCKETWEMMVDLGTVDASNSSLKGYSFVRDLLKYALEYRLSDCADRAGMCVTNNLRFSAGKTNTITKYISQNTDTACIQLEISHLCRDMEKAENMEKTVQALIDAITILATADWDAEALYVFKAKRSKVHFPQDKVQFCSDVSINMGEVLILQADGQAPQQAIRYQTAENTCAEGDILLTNRLIGNLFHTKIDQSVFENRPVLVYACRKKQLGIGRPIVEEREISVSDNVFRELVSEKRDYILYNKYTNTKYCLKLRNYGGMINDRIFMPYYYRQLLMAEYPLQEIQETYYKQLMQELKDDKEKKSLKSCYELRIWEKVYVLKDGLRKEQIDQLKKLEEQKLGNNPLELLTVPPNAKKGRHFWKEMLIQIKELLLKLYIGYTVYELRVCRPMAMDDQNDTARLSLNMMQILGVAPNDKLLIRFGNKQVNLRVLEAQSKIDSDMLIGLPARARKELGICDINDIVEVKRNMTHIFLSNMSRQVFAVLGSILTVTALSENIIFRLIVSIILTPIAIYLVMSDVRIGIKKGLRDAEEI